MTTRQTSRVTPTPLGGERDPPPCDWRWGLEAAMLAHLVVHLAVAKKIAKLLEQLEGLVSPPDG